jgi:hypothetical protein
MSDEEHLAPQVQPAVAAKIVPVNIPLPPPLDMNGDLATNWKQFKQVWQNYEIAGRL